MVLVGLVLDLSEQDLKHVPGIMPDHWIREQAQNHGMIEPFAEKQNREKNGQKISLALFSFF